MRIPEDKIEEIRNSVSIVDFISGYVQLKKRGKNFIGLCPFHQEKTPSFTVSEDKQIYHCFGCHAGGNVFKFLMDYKNISFIEAVEEVAKYAGITIKAQQGYNALQNKYEVFYEINLKAARYFSNNLFDDLEGQFARDYLLNRNIKQQTQKTFGLGYAKQSWTNFLSFAEKQSIDIEKCKILGLLDQKENGAYYDKFRGRVMFPIFSPNGRVIAFGGRILEKNENAAKYLNSPESLIYSKRKSLYGLFHSKDEIRKLDKAILVEGYMDLISLYQNGIKNIVASSGTSLTEEQVQLLSRYTKNIIVLFDADSAGQKASLRSIELLLKQDFDVKILSLQEGEDPDSFVNKFGKEAFNEQLLKAQNFLEYQTEQFEKSGMFKEPAKQTEAIRQLIKSASLVTDNLKRSILLKTIAKKFNLREKLLETELGKFISQNQSLKNRNLQHNTNLNRKSTMEILGVDEKESYALEREIIKILLEGKEKLTGYILDHIQPDDFKNKVFQNIATTVHDAYVNNIVSPSAIIDRIEDEKLKEFTREIILKDESISRKWGELSPEGEIHTDLFQYTSDVVKKYRIKQIDEVIRETNREITQADETVEVIDKLKLIKELQTEKKIILNEKAF